MSVLEWSPTLEIGVYEIDLQHRNLVAIANHLHDAIESGKPPRTIEWMLEELRLYAKFHFETEERYMKRYKTPEGEAHAREHAELIKALKRFRRKLGDDEADVEGEVLEFLSGWLAGHLTGSDRELGASVRRRMEELAEKPLRKRNSTAGGGDPA